MVIFKDNKGFQTRSDKPNENWTNNNDVYVVKDGTELANKIIQAYPHYNFVTDDNGNLIDVDVLGKPNTLLELKLDKITQSKQQLSAFLETHPLEYNGEYYSVTQEKQALLTSAIAAYQLKVQAGIPAALKWNTTGDVCREFTLEEIIGLVIAITDYVQPMVEKQQELEVQIRSCTTIEELDSIIIDYEVV